MRRSRSTLGILICLASVAGCYSGSSADGGDAPGGDDETAGTAGTAGTATASDPTGEDTDPGQDAPPEIPAPTIRRLTATAYTHSVRALLGVFTLSTTETDSLKEGFFAVGNATIAVSPAGVALYEKALEQATSQGFSDAARAATVVPCVPATTDDLVCFRDSVASFGRRAWRRTLTGAEIERYLAIATTIASETGDSLAGLRHAAWGLLESPNFLYRVEIGEPAAEDPSRLQYTAYEMASRLSYTLWNTTPDDALLDAAERGDLGNPDGIRAEALRMLADARARQGVQNFVGELYSIWRLTDLSKDAATYPEWTPSLKAAIREDLLARINDVVFDAPGDFLSLYDGNKVFVTNELADLYGVPAADPDVLRAAELPADGLRRGLIGSAAILAMNSPPARTSATKRGQFIADALLCRVVPPPPPGIDLDLDKDMEGGGPKTAREQLKKHREDPACAGCHNLMDPMGLALEHFDSMGAFRPDDQGLVIDASGDLDGLPFANGSELASLLRDHPEAPMCLTRKLYTYVTGRLPVYSELELVRLLEDDLLREDNRFDQLLLSLVTRDEFRFANPEGTVIAPDQGEMP